MENRKFKYIFKINNDIKQRLQSFYLDLRAIGRLPLVCAKAKVTRSSTNPDENFWSASTSATPRHPKPDLFILLSKTSIDNTSASEVSQMKDRNWTDVNETHRAGK